MTIQNHQLIHRKSCPYNGYCINLKLATYEVQNRCKRLKKKSVGITSDAPFTLEFVDLGNFKPKNDHSKIHPIEMKKGIFTNLMPA